MLLKDWTIQAFPVTDPSETELVKAILGHPLWPSKLASLSSLFICNQIPPLPPEKEKLGWQGCVVIIPSKASWWKSTLTGLFVMVHSNAFLQFFQNSNGNINSYSSRMKHWTEEYSHPMRVVFSSCSFS